MHGPANTSNIFAGYPANLPQELVDVLIQHDKIRIERIVSTNHSSPEGFWYDQAEHEWVVILQGNATLAFEGGEVAEMSPGDHRLIPARQRHRVEWTSDSEPTVWLAVFFPE
jgi:cupin 2 domain-containing protein